MKGWITPKPESNIRLNIGSGNPGIAHEQYPDIPFLCQDIAYFEGLDLQCDIRELRKYIGSGKCEYIMAVHVLEHFGTNEIPDIFRMLYDITMVGGRVDIIVPNIYYHLALIKDNQDDLAIHYCFGGQEDEYDFHKTGFTPNILRTRLEKAGFKILNMEENTSILANTIKP